MFKIMRKRFLVIFVTILLVALCACNEADKIEKNNSKETESQNKKIVREYNLEKDIALSANRILVLQADGRIKAKGDNENGELGDGSRTDAEEWVTVEGLDNAIGIYSDNGWSIALTESGEVYYWGHNHLVPEKLEGLSNIKEILYTSGTFFEKEFGDGRGRLLAKTEDGSAYVLATYTSRRQLEYIQRPELKGVTDCVEDLLVKNGSVYVYTNNDGLVKIDRLSNISVITEGRHASGRAFFQCIDYSDGSVFQIEKNHAIEFVDHFSELQLEVDFLGGEGYKDLYLDSDGYNEGFFSVELFYSGTILTQGENEEGQLGDGTTSQYYDGAWEVEIPETINQIFYKPPANTVYALDNENNIWAWGEGFGSTPEIYFNADDASSY